MQSMPLVFENDVLALMSFFLFIYQFPYCLFFSPQKNCQDALVKPIKWNSSAPYWIAVRHCMHCMYVLFFSFFIQKTLSAKVKTMKLVKTTMRRPLYRWWDRASRENLPAAFVARQPTLPSGPPDSFVCSRLSPASAFAPRTESGRSGAANAGSLEGALTVVPLDWNRTACCVGNPAVSTEPP